MKSIAPFRSKIELLDSPENKRSVIRVFFWFISTIFIFLDKIYFLRYCNSFIIIASNFLIVISFPLFQFFEDKIGNSHHGRPATLTLVVQSRRDRSHDLASDDESAPLVTPLTTASSEALEPHIVPTV